jgi:hypothetical protein
MVRHNARHHAPYRPSTPLSFLAHAAVAMAAYARNAPGSVAAGHDSMLPASVTVFGFRQLGGDDRMIYLGTAGFELNLRMCRCGESEGKGKSECE